MDEELEQVDLLAEGDELDQASDPIPAAEPKPTDPLVKHIPKARPKFDPALKLRHYTPSVARHIAKIYVNKADGDMAATLAWLRPGFSDEEYSAYAKYLLKQEQVRVAISREYAAIGIDEDGKKKFIGELWRTVIEGTGKDRQVALPLLGRAMGIGEMQEEGRVLADLPLKNLDAGWKKMTSKEAELAQQSSGFDTLSVDKDTKLPE